MLRVGQVDVCAGLVDYKVHVIIIEPSSDVWGKKNRAYYAATSKDSASPVLQQETCTTRSRPSWASLRGAGLGYGMGMGSPLKEQLEEQGRPQGGPARAEGRVRSSTGGALH